MDKLDLAKQYKELYAPPAKKVVLVEVPELAFLMIDGKMEPGASPGNSPSFQHALEALYGVSYTLKFMSKLRSEDPIDYRVMGLEALWWVEDGHFDITKPGNWHWCAMILQPDHITVEMFQAAIGKMNEKKPNPALEILRLERFCEGLCVQTMHIGPYATEPETMIKMEMFALQQHYGMHKKHHEIYIGNPLKADPAKLKTILRHPVFKMP